VNANTAAIVTGIVVVGLIARGGPCTASIVVLIVVIIVVFSDSGG
jgi:hypothetical protein